MAIPGSAAPGLAPADLLTGLVYGLLKILAWCAVGVVVAGMVATFLCDRFERRTWRQGRGPSLV